MSRKPRLAIMGASVRAAAQSAVRAGYEVVAADLFADEDLPALCHVTRIDPYPAGFIEWLAQQRFDAWLYTGALENYPELVDRLATIGPLWGVAGETLQQTRDPAWLAALCERAAIRFPDTRKLEQMPRDVSGWLAKTYRHSSGAGVWPLTDEESRRRAVAAGAYAQRPIRGLPMAAIYVVGTNQAQLAGVVEHLPPSPSCAAHRFGFHGALGPAALPSAAHAALQRLAVALPATGLCGLIGVDLILSEDEPVLLEINPRYTASVEVVERMTGAALLAAHAAAVGGEPLPVRSLPTAFAGKRIVYASGAGVVSLTLATWALEMSHAGGVADVPAAGVRFAAGDPLCTLLAAAASKQAVLSELQALEATCRALLTVKN